MQSNHAHRIIALIPLIISLFIATIAHGYNMFYFPYYENDEGIYMSQAWSLITRGTLSPYTYWYDHAPAGWILIAAWTVVSGGFFTFGNAINSGRILMLLLHIGTALGLFFIAKRLTGRVFPAVLATIIFSLSPLAIYFQRRVLLDNIMTFWVVMSLALLLKAKARLSHAIVSAIFFGIAVLTKENAIFFLPGFLYVLHICMHPHHRRIAMLQWIAISSGIIGLYILYALLKNELFPIGFLGDYSERVSLISTIQQQVSRGGSYPFWDQQSDFFQNMREWIGKDPAIILLGTATTLGGIVLSLKEKTLRIPLLFTILFLLFLMRGKLVIDFYILPLFPFLSLTISVVFSLFISKLSFNKRWVYLFLNSVFIVFISSLFLLNTSLGQWTRNETQSQIRALSWIKSNLPESSIIAIDASFFIDLQSKKTINDPLFPNAHWAWKIEKDPDIYEDILRHDWRNIEYIALSHEMLKQIQNKEFLLIKQALSYASLIQAWNDGSISYVDIPHYISTNGDWMAIYKVKTRDEIMLEQSWRYFKQHFIQSYGNIIDPMTNNTTSEGQSYAMLRAVWQNDKTTFDGVWRWTKDHLQHRLEDNLFSWVWTNDGEGKVIDTASASDADQDIALALLFAYKRWSDSRYLDDALDILEDIWRQEVVRIKNRYYLVSSSEAERPNGYLVNPSYMFPAAYRIFAEADPSRPWTELADDSYYLLQQIANLSRNTSNLLPNWILVEKQTGSIQSAKQYINDPNSDDYGFDAFRNFWRAALDAAWFGRPEAVAYLKESGRFFEEEWREKRNIVSIYTTSGLPRSNFNTVSTSVGPLAIFSITAPNLADDIYQQIIEQSFNHKVGYWGNPTNYYDQNWAWFGTALHKQMLPNLWKEHNASPLEK